MLIYNNKGVTLASLSIYIVVSVIILSSLTFLNVNLMSQVAELSQKSEYSNEMLKAQAALLTDIKAANRVLDYSEQHLEFDNGVRYTIKYRANSKLGEQTYDVYELYRNDVLITDKMTNLSFGYTFEYNPQMQENYIKWVTLNMLDVNLAGNEIRVRVGKGY